MKSFTELNEDDTQRFYELLKVKKFLIKRALYKVNIPQQLHSEFYSFGMEGLLVSFLILQDGGISPKDFDRFAFTTIKRKLIDEIRRRNKNKSVPLDIFDNNSDVISNDYDLLYIELISYLKKTLKSAEWDYFEEYIKTLNIKQTAISLGISLASAYRLHKHIKGVCEQFLLSI